MSITIVRSFAIDPPTEVVCTDGEWTISNDRMRIAVAADTVGKAMEAYASAWQALMTERLREEVARLMGATA